MKNIHSIQYKNIHKEELIPGFSADFPHISSYVELDKYIGRHVPWHWHKEIELFYVKNGDLEYHTPKGITVFPEGSAGIINSNRIHMTMPYNKSRDVIQFVHLFDAALIAGQHGGRIEKKYITPFTSAAGMELIKFDPQIIEHQRIIQQVHDSFLLQESTFAYEVQLRGLLSGIWCHAIRQLPPDEKENKTYQKTSDKLKRMMIFIHEHFHEKLSISEIAASSYVSDRECFRTFQNILHVTPYEYLRNYRLQQACGMLIKTNDPVTSIGTACGLGSSSYFGKVFREQTGYTPLAYRRKWQDIDI